jgi:hypothetical protein
MQLSCSFCGRVCSDTDNFCAGCGARLEQQGQTAQPALPVPVRAIEPVPRRGGMQPALRRAGQLLRRVAASSAARELAKAAVPLAAYVGYRLLERALTRPVAPASTAASPRQPLPLRPILPAPTEPAPPPRPAGLIVRETVIISRQVAIRRA